MPVIPDRIHCFQDRKDLYQLLLRSQQKSTETKHEQIVSISWKIEAVDPLAVLQHLAQPHQVHFFWEKPCQSIAIAAIDVTTSFKISGPNRFFQAQNFINTCLENIVTTGDLSLPFSGPHFFCQFTFFDQPAFDQSAHTGDLSTGTVFLPRWQVARQNHECTVVANLEIDAQTDLEDLLEETWQVVRTIQTIKYQLPELDRSYTKFFHKQDVTDTENFKFAVFSALESIEKQQLQKIVLAHAVDVVSPFPFRITDSLNNLRKLYPDCYIFSASNGRGQTFIGASPERLLSIHHRQLVTDALAGSAPRGQTLSEDAALSKRLLVSAKELHEHRVVIDFITQCLSRLGLTPRLAALPRLLKLPNIQHLRTPIQAEVPLEVHPLEILAELHPTPAVAGVPREVACEQIRQYEAFERALYAAPLGWLDHQGNSEFIVGIRSALIEGCQARLYAGAGIVAGSDPQKELAEIKLKLQALLAALV